MDQTGVECFQELHVLAVDDSFVDRKVIERLLKISCCKVTVVENGRKALQYLGLDGEEKSPNESSDVKVNLILSDYSMPGMTGYELLKKIKGSAAYSQVPMVIMSSENMVTRIDRCLEEGAEDFLLKPVKLSDIKRIRDSILNFGATKNAKEQTCTRQLSDDLSAPPQKLSLNHMWKRKHCEDLSSHAQKLSVAIDTAA